jgi:hypothetical protein
MADKHFTRVDSTAFEHFSNSINAVAETLALLSPLVVQQQGIAEHLPRVASALAVLSHYLDLRNEYLVSLMEACHE